MHALSLLPRGRIQKSTTISTLPYIFDWVQEHTRQTNTCLIHYIHVNPETVGQVLFLSVFTLFRFILVPAPVARFLSEPASVQDMWEHGSVVPAPTAEIGFSVMVVWAVSFLGPSSGLAVVGVEYSLGVLGRPFPVGPDGMRCIDSFESVVESDSGRPHFGLHTSSLEILLVHHMQQPARETAQGIDERSSWNSLKASMIKAVVSRVLSSKMRSSLWNEVPDVVTV